MALNCGSKAAKTMTNIAIAITISRRVRAFLSYVVLRIAYCVSLFTPYASRFRHNEPARVLVFRYSIFAIYQRIVSVTVGIFGIKHRSSYASFGLSACKGKR